MRREKRHRGATAVQSALSVELPLALFLSSLLLNHFVTTYPTSPRVRAIFVSVRNGRVYVAHCEFRDRIRRTYRMPFMIGRSDS
ncbi:hypothetical protein V5799_032784 [Amblyomma americanum]|uniref:Uncharacterized protein n=1 Tax=Amblyomma americanum TaxID=6943 RepID=A0AAQ4DQ66_AMBAM